MRSLLGLLVLLVASGQVEAETTGLARPVNGKVEEGFDPTARVAGSRIVGVRIGASVAPGAPHGAAFDPAGVEIVAAAAERIICVRAISRDGLYWMRTPYRAETAGPTLTLAPFTDASDRLRKYAQDEIAIYAFESSDPECLDRSVVVLPAVGTLAGATLEVLVNSGNRRVTARLAKGAREVDLTCAAPVSQERITFDRVCTVAMAALPDPTGTLELKLTLDDGLSRSTQDYPIRMPGAAP